MTKFCDSRISAIGRVYWPTGDDSYNICLHCYDIKKKHNLETWDCQLAVAKKSLNRTSYRVAVEHFDSIFFRRMQTQTDIRVGLQWHL